MRLGDFSRLATRTTRDLPDEIVVSIEDRQSRSQLGDIHNAVAVDPDVVRTVQAGLFFDKLPFGREDLNPVILSVGDPESLPTAARVEPHVVNQTELARPGPLAAP